MAPLGGVPSSSGKMGALAGLHRIQVGRPQVMKDVHSKAMEAAEMGDSEALATERVAWLRRDQRAWSDMAKPEHNEPERKLYRTKSHEWLLATDHQMWCCTGKRWADYIQPEQDHRFTQPPLEPCGVVTCSVNQGADGWQALQYLMYEMRVAVVAVKDPSHRLWRDTWLAISHAHLKPLCVLLSIVLSADHGPWQDARWFQASKEAASSYMQLGGIDDLLFQRQVDQMAAEMGIAHQLCEGALHEEVFKAIPEAMLKMTTTVAQGRLFGLFQSLEHFLPLRTRRYIVLAYLGLQEGLYENAGLSVMTKMKVQAADRRSRRSRRTDGSGGVGHPGPQAGVPQHVALVLCLPRRLGCLRVVDWVARGGAPDPRRVPAPA